MTYRAGIAPSVARVLGWRSHPEPTYTCDMCGTVVGCYTRGGLPKKHVTAGRPPPGWVEVWRDLEPVPPRRHYCRNCHKR